MEDHHPDRGEDHLGSSDQGGKRRGYHAGPRDIERHAEAEIERAEAARLLDGCYRRFGALFAVKGHGGADVDVGDAVAIGHAEQLVVAQIGPDASEPAAGLRDFTGVHQRDPPGLDIALVDGDALIYIIARDRVTQGLPLAGVVGTLMSNQGLERGLSQRGLDFARAAVGDRHVLSLLKERGWRLGGEGSGHLIGLNWHSTGDGVIAALRVMVAMKRARQTLAQLCEGLKMNAQFLVNVPLTPGTRMVDGEWLARFQERAEQQLGGLGRVLLRASGTEPVVRVLVECADQVLEASIGEPLEGERARVTVAPHALVLFEQMS